MLIFPRQYSQFSKRIAEIEKSTRYGLYVARASACGFSANSHIRKTAGSSPRHWSYQERTLFEVRVKTLVVWASQHGIDLLAELLCVPGGDVLVEGFLVLPDLHDGDVIGPGDLRAGFYAHEALIFAAIGNILLYECCTCGRTGRCNIDVRHNENLVMPRHFLGNRPTRKPAHSQYQYRTRAQQCPSREINFRLHRHFRHLSAIRLIQVLFVDPR